MSTKLGLHILSAQINPVMGDLGANAAIIKNIVRGSPPACDLIVFPEMVLCGYPPEDLILKPSFVNKIKDISAYLAKELKDFPAIILPVPWQIEGRLYNAALLIEGGEIISVTCKHHLPNYGVFDEQRLFTAGALPAPVTVKGHKIGLMICEDMWFPDIAAHLKEQGAELLISVNASPFTTTKYQDRLTHARARCAETGLALVYVNLWGGQDELVFDGVSFSMNAAGAVSCQSPAFADHHRMLQWPLPDDAASPPPSLPDEHAMIYGALICGLRDYVHKNGFPGALIGLSGGIDSALCAAIAVDALGAKAVQCVMMPSRFTSPDSLHDAESCAKALGAAYDTIPITGLVAAFDDTLAPFLDKDAPSETFENIQSRCRGALLMALSNAGGSMVVSTGNKSEMAVGYATLYGDMCGGFNPVKDIYKSRLYALARWRNQNIPVGGLCDARDVIPVNIIDKAPTAELRENQTDQDSLPPYDVLDDILDGLIEREESLDDLATRGYDAALVTSIWKMLDRAEYKRRQAPPGVKITARAFGRDRRYPITNRFIKMIEK